MLGVDRLDMIKGIPQKLLAFEEFLEEHPEWRDKVLLVQIAVPSRTDVPEYQVSRHRDVVLGLPYTLRLSRLAYTFTHLMVRPAFHQTANWVLTHHSI